MASRATPVPDVTENSSTPPTVQEPENSATPPTTETSGESAPAASPAQTRAPRTNDARSTSLHVADLKPTTTESMLYEFFRMGLQGENRITSVRVCRNNTTNESLCYAYVNFANVEDAEHALKELNYNEIDGRPCRISWSQRDPAMRKSGKGNLFVKYLDKELDHFDLHGIFESFGAIHSCKVSTDRITGKSRGYGFVQFVDPEDAKRAMTVLHKKYINGKEIFVGPFIPRSGRGTGPSNFTNLFLKQFNLKLNPEQFAELLKKATEDIGELTSPFLAIDDVTKESKGFGFANFANHEVAVKALERLRDTEKMKELVPDLLSPVADLYVSQALSKRQRQLEYAKGPPNRNLYIKNIDDSVTNEMLSNFFSQFGTLASPARIMVNSDSNTPKGFGFVCFETQEGASKAIQGAHGQQLAGKPLYVAIAQPKEQRQRQLNQQMLTRGGPMARFPPYGYPMGMYPPGGVPRGMPYGVPRGPPRGMPHVAPQHNQVPRGGDLRAAVQHTEDEKKTQLLGDRLFSMLSRTLGDLQSRQMVGMILGSTNEMSLGDAVEYLLRLIENPDALDSVIQRNLQMMNNAPPQ